MPRIIAAAAVAAAATRKSHTKALTESADSVLRSNVEVARTLPATTKLICGLVDEITCDELGELFVALGSTAEGNLSFTTFALLLRKVVGLGTEAIDELQGCLGIDEAGMVSEKALLACLQDGGRAERSCVTGTSGSQIHREFQSMDLVSSSSLRRLPGVSAAMTLSVLCR